MLVLSSEQEKDWKQIRKLLEDNGVDFVEIGNIANGLTEAKELYCVASQAEEEAVMLDNESFVNEDLSIIAVLAKVLGYEGEEYEISFTKTESHDYQSTYSMESKLDEKISSVLLNEGEEVGESWGDEYLTDNNYNYVVSLMEMDESKTHTVKIPNRVATYNIMES